MYRDKIVGSVGKRIRLSNNNYKHDERQFVQSFRLFDMMNTCNMTSKNWKYIISTLI